jgi:predicted  nucleic acid-binding Zn-ribbon protein
VYGKAREIDEKGRIKPTDLSGPIGAQLQAAQNEEKRIRASIEGADLPFDEVSSEVDALVRSMERVCHRADLVYRYLEGQNPAQVQWRLQQLQQEAGNSPDSSQKQLIDALQQQLEALDSLSEQLKRFYSQMEHTVTSLGAIGARIVQASVAEEDAAQRELATQVRDLRDQVGGLAEGMKEAYAQADDTPGLPSTTGAASAGGAA